MQLKTFLFDEDRGVSPVIGVILMVAITVILAAVIATFVMNMGPGEAQQPNVQWDWDSSVDSSGDLDTATLSHTGGDEADPSNFIVEVDGDEETLESITGSGDDLTASDEVDLMSGSDISPEAGEEVTLIWENPNNDQTQTVETYELEE